jgi:hypothetical protein
MTTLSSSLKEATSKVKFTKELIYILLDRLPYGPFCEKLNPLIINNNIFAHSYSKLYVANGKRVNFRELWTILGTMNMNGITNISYNNKKYSIEGGYIDIPELTSVSDKEILNDLMWRVHDTGSISGDDVIIKEIFDAYIASKQ